MIQRSSRSALAAVPAALAVVGIGAVLQLWGLDRAPFHTKGEPREAVVVQQIVNTGSWVLPRRNGVEIPAKPPLFHWLAALVARLRGQADEASIRLPSALLSVAAAVLISITGTLLWSTTAGLTAAAATLTSFEWMRAATTARVDMTLTAGLTLTLCGLALFRARGTRIWLLAAYAGMLWAVLAKGPVGLALPLLQIIAVTLADRRLSFVRSLRLFRGLLVVLVLGSVWYALAFLEGGQAFFAKQVLTENVWRFFGGTHFTEGHRHTVAYLLGAFAAGLLPWTLLMPSVGYALWRERQTLARRDPQPFLLIWAVLVFGFYAMAASKRGVYLLAAYPAVFLLLGWWVDATRRHAAAPWTARVLSVVAWCAAFAAAGIALVAAGEGDGLPLLSAIAALVPPRAARDLRPVVDAFHATAPLVPFLFFGAAVAAAMAACAARAQRWRLAVAMLFLAAAPAITAVRQVVLPEIARAKTRQGFVAALKRTFGETAELSAYRGFDYGFVYYWGRNVPVYRDPLSAAAPARLIIAGDDWQRASPMERAYYQRVPLIASAASSDGGALLYAQRIVAPPRDASPPDAPPPDARLPGP